MSTQLASWRLRFEAEVDHRLEVPVQAQQVYVALLAQSLVQADMEIGKGTGPGVPQACVLVDRSQSVQAACIVVGSPASGWHWLGATAVSTGKVGRYEHFVTPLGVFVHSPDNPDFRAEGTFNSNRIRGYGLRGLRVFDFGWQSGERGWGKGGESPMRLQMHATDPIVLEGRLGTVQSEGCVRIPTSLNRFLDHHGVLDLQYFAALDAGEKLWVIPTDQERVPWPGQYMVVVDSGTLGRPAWSPLPAVPVRG